MRGTDISNIKEMYRKKKRGEMPDQLILTFQKERSVRYGENPQQNAAIYTANNNTVELQTIKKGEKGISATNVLDASKALDILKYFNNSAVAVMKHLIPSGVAVKKERLQKVYQLARDTDTQSAFGSVVECNRPIDEKTAQEICSSYVECVVAPSMDKQAQKIFKPKKNIRLITYKGIEKLLRYEGDQTAYETRILHPGRFLVQESLVTRVKNMHDLITDAKIDDCTVQRDPTSPEIADLLTAWYITMNVRSNGIVLVKDGVTTAIGSGQQDRVGAVELAIKKAGEKARGSVLSSDGFFPFRDSIDLAGKAGITAIIQPGGSIRDKEILKAVNEYNMALVLTAERCFGHF